MVPEKVGVKQVHLDEMIQVCMIVSTAARPLPGGEEAWTMREPLLEGIRGPGHDSTRPQGRPPPEGLRG
jgi:hypothetical protein